MGSSFEDSPCSHAPAWEHEEQVCIPTQERGNEKAWERETKKL